MKLQAALFSILFSLPALAQSAPDWQEGLVKHLPGSWKLEGKIVGTNAHHDVQIDWVFNRQFLRITEKTSADAPSSERRYDAIWYLGYDAVSERFVMHLLDTYGGRFSETLGYGTLDGNTIKFVFEYPDGPFHTTYRWNPQENSWQWLMEQKRDGKSELFGDMKLTRHP